MDQISAWGYPALVTKFDDISGVKGLLKGSGLKAPPVVYTEGVVNSFVAHMSSVVHSAQISQGSSGGPLINSRGELVGINTWGTRDEKSGALLNAALPADELAVFLTAHGVNLKFVPRQILQDREDRVRDVGSFTVKVPHGWSVAEEEKDGILLASDDKAALMLIAVENNEGKSVQEIASILAQQRGGTQPISVKDGGATYYSFSSSVDDKGYRVFVRDMGNGRHYKIFSSGNADNPGGKQILGSLEKKAAEIMHYQAAQQIRSKEGASRGGYERYFEDYCARWGVPLNLALAIAMHESGMNPWAVGNNTTRKSNQFKTREQALQYIESALRKGESLDIGLMQINSMWLGKFKINPAEALEPQFNVILGVGILATEIKRHGLTWRAVAAYNVGGGRVDTLRKTAEEYAIKVFRQFEKLEKGS